MKKLFWILLLILFSYSTAQAQVDVDITFAWDLHAEATTVIGFRLYMSEVSGQYTYGAGNAIAIETGGTSIQTGPVYITLDAGTTRFFVLTAHNVEGESSPSNEVSYTAPDIPDEIPPDSPYSLGVTLKFTPTGTQIYMEAEGVPLYGNLIKVTDATASGGEFILANATGAFSDPLNPNYAEYSFNVPAGDYAIWGRVLAPNAGSDSFWVTVDTATSHLWDTLVHTTWGWQRISDRGGGPVNGGADVTFTLTSGSHILRVSQREDGTQLDRILITNDLVYIP